MDNQETPYCQLYMPDGKPVPLVLDDVDLIKLLRLEKHNIENARWTLKYYRDKGLLKGVRLGKRIRYTRDEVLKFLEKQTERTNQNSA